MKKTKLATLLSLATLLTACGAAPRNDAPVVPSNLTPIGQVSGDGVITRSRVVMNITTVAPSLATRLFKNFWSTAYAASGNQAVTVVNSPNSSITLDSSMFLVPAINNSMIDFGTLLISSLFDNSLSVCGNGKQKCGTAVIRIYTAGVAGSGVWNNPEGYGAPLTAALINTPPSGTVGLNVTGAVTVQSLSLASNKHTIRQSDFAAIPKYNIKADFTDAGSGSFSTTLVIDYGLSL